MTRPPAHHSPGLDGHYEPGRDSGAAGRRRAVQASLRAARQEAESLRGLLLELRATFTEVRGQADRELVRLGLQDVPAPWGNPHGQE